MLNTLRDILDFRRLPMIAVANRSLLWQFVKRSVSARYRGSVLGLFWSFVHPMMMLCVYTFVFSVVFKSRWGVDTGGGRGASTYQTLVECKVEGGELLVRVHNVDKGTIAGEHRFKPRVVGA